MICKDQVTRYLIKNIHLFKAHYHWVEQGGYAWGSKSEVLDWPDEYPDALIPQSLGCSNLNKDTPIFESFSVPKDKN